MTTTGVLRGSSGSVIDETVKSTQCQFRRLMTAKDFATQQASVDEIGQYRLEI
jgi:hypothetical protein